MLDEWITTFNYVRPHESLGMRTPSDVYRPSSRRRQFYRLGGFPGDCSLVMVKGRYVHWQGRRIHIGAAFDGYPVGLRPLEADRMEV